MLVNHNDFLIIFIKYEKTRIIKYNQYIKNLILQNFMHLNKKIKYWGSDKQNWSWSWPCKKARQNPGLPLD